MTSGHAPWGMAAWWGLPYGRPGIVRANAPPFLALLRALLPALLLALLRALLLEDGLANRNGVGDSEAVTLEQLLSRSRSAVVV